MNLQKDLENFIQGNLLQLKNLPKIDISENKLPDFIYSKLTSTTYRRHSISDEYKAHIKNVINTSISEKKPIPLVWVFGAYKLWRLPESPFVDWAELFFLMHKVNWLKPILSVYKPGVWFDFFADGILVPKLNNLPKEDMDKYKESFLNLLDFIKNGLPKNLSFTLHTLEELYGSEKDFMKEFEDNLKKVVELDNVTPFVLTDQQKSTIRMNVKSDINLTEKELHDNQLLFEAFVLSSKRRPYYRTTDKIFLDSFPIKNTLPIGSTRDSSVRFWIGIGALKKHKDSFLETILSVKQLSELKPKKYPVTIKGLVGHNFQSINFIT